jgi:hypothetical protein
MLNMCEPSLLTWQACADHAEVKDRHCHSPSR